MPPKLTDFLSEESLDFENFRSEVVADCSYVPSFGRHNDLQRQIDMLEHEFVGQLQLKFVHAVLNVLLRRGIETKIVYGHFHMLWAGHADILLDTLDSRWLISACETICDHSDDPTEASSAILLSLFINSLKLAETERLITSPVKADPTLIKGRTPLFDGMTAFMPGGDMPANLLGRLNRTLQPETLVGLIGRELIGRALSANTVFARFAPLQTKNSWNTFLPPVRTPRQAGMLEPIAAVAEPDRSGYILLNDTGRLSGGFHLGTLFACSAIRQNLSDRGLQEIGWANDRARFDALIERATQQPALVVLNGEGTLHHGAKRAVELLSICVRAKEKGMNVAVINSVWEKNPDAMVLALQQTDLVHVRDSLSQMSLPAGFPAKVTPDVSIKLFLKTMREGEFPPSQHKIAVMDSVLPAVSDSLLDFAEQEKFPFFTMPEGSLRKTRDKVVERSSSIWPRLLQLTDVMTSEAWVTGRFHGLIAALCAGRPVCVLSSNTAKIEGFLQDGGLTEACFLDETWLAASAEMKRDELGRRFEMQQTETFIERRDLYLKDAATRIDLMFDQIAVLAGGKAPVQARTS